MFFTFIIFLLSSLDVTAWALHPRQSEEEFSLYAYGDGFSGFKVVYDNDLAYLIDPNIASDLNTTTVTFTVSNSVLTAHVAVNSTAFVDGTFFVPIEENDLSHQAGFLNPERSVNSTDNIALSGWLFYGHVLALNTEETSWENLFSACETETDGLFTLNWEVSGELEENSCTFVTLKNTTPTVITRVRK